MTMRYTGSNTWLQQSETAWDGKFKLAYARSYRPRWLANQDRNRWNVRRL